VVCDHFLLTEDEAEMLNADRYVSGPGISQVLRPHIARCVVGADVHMGVAEFLDVLAEANGDVELRLEGDPDSCDGLRWHPYPLVTP
jgi:hypothetical protein